MFSISLKYPPSQTLAIQITFSIRITIFSQASDSYQPLNLENKLNPLTCPSQAPPVFQTYLLWSTNRTRHQ